MTAPAPLTPANEPAALTDEELALWEQDTRPRHDVTRLIAALRASRTRIKELEAERDAYKADYQQLYQSEFGY